LRDPLFNDLLPLEQVLALIERTFPGPRKTGLDTVATRQAIGRVLAAPVISPCALPGFRRSTVDGFALQAASVQDASAKKPARLRVAGEVAMGRLPDFTLVPGEAALIPTGGALPQGADAVVMVEHTLQALANEVEIQRPVAAWENIIEADADARQGAEVFASNLELRPEHIGLLCGLGLETIAVRRRLRATVFSTGDEVVAPDAPANPGQVRDINGPMLVAALTRDGCQARYGGILPDRLDRVSDTLRAALADNDLMLISGGSSVGRKDHTAAAIADLGPPGVLIHGVGIKPGKPMIVGQSAAGHPLLGMPGNPTSAQIAYLLVVRPLLRRLQTGRSPAIPATITAELTRSLQGGSGRAEYARVRLEQREGRTLATPLRGESGLISTLTDADGLVALPASVRGIEAGALVEVLPLG
jgi:molybdopterin molybdotransferase